MLSVLIEFFHGDSREVTSSQCLNIRAEVSQKVDLLEGGTQGPSALDHDLTISL